MVSIENRYATIKRSVEPHWVLSGQNRVLTEICRSTLRLYGTRQGSMARSIVLYRCTTDIRTHEGTY